MRIVLFVGILFLLVSCKKQEAKSTITSPQDPAPATEPSSQRECSH